MSRERLREAIEYMDRHLFAHDTKRFRLVLAAARAYACKRCDGDGRLYNDFGTYYAECRDCAEYRRIADGEEKQ